jgi:hypothetical protein
VFQGGIHSGDAYQHGPTTTFFQHLQGDLLDSLGNGHRSRVGVHG